MNINKFTQKSMQAVQDCEKLAYQYGNQEIDQEHQDQRNYGGHDKRIGIPYRFIGCQAVASVIHTRADVLQAGIA